MIRDHVTMRWMIVMAAGVRWRQGVENDCPRAAMYCRCSEVSTYDECLWQSLDERKVVMP